MRQRVFSILFLLLLNLCMSAQETTTTSHEYVDLGLSVKWATCNVGAVSRESLGSRYAWGETVPKKEYEFTNYRFMETIERNVWGNTLHTYEVTKYSLKEEGSFKSFMDRREFLDPIDDAATVNWGESWRTPSIAEWYELAQYCTWTKTKSNGTLGYLVTSLINGNSIFFPLDQTAEKTRFWTAQLEPTDTTSWLNPGGYKDWGALCYGFNDHAVSHDIENRPEGLYVRPVFDGQEHEAVLPKGFRNYKEYCETRGERHSVLPEEGKRIRLKAVDRMYQIPRKTPSDGTVDGHEYADLGLSVKWATVNMGSPDAATPGERYAWGETKPKTSGDWSNYQMATLVTVTRHFHHSGKKEVDKKWVMNDYNDKSIYEKPVDGITITEEPHVELDYGYTLDNKDDAAYVNWGTNWRIPTIEQLRELRDNCTWIRIDEGGLHGFRIISNVNGNYIFLPDTGRRNVSDFATNPYASREQDYGHYWTKTREQNIIKRARALFFTPSRLYYSGQEEGLDMVERCIPLSIRPVTEAVGKPSSPRKPHQTTPVNVKSNLSLPVAPAKPQAVDLGLSVKWATFNVGANRPEGDGDFFAWGETKPKTDFRRENYTLNGTGKYGLQEMLETVDDAATANWGKDWRTPTIEEFRELMEKCDWSFTTRNGVKGWIITSRVNANSIFMPSVKIDATTSADRRDGAYMTASSDDEDLRRAYRIEWINSDGDGARWEKKYERFRKSSLRPVQGAPVLGKKEDHAESSSRQAAVGSRGTHDYVDMGVSVLWATCNLGAESPYDYGDVIAWGETQQKVNLASSDKEKKYSEYVAKKTKYYKPSDKNYTKYVHKSSKFPKADDIEILEPDDDAATQNWGAEWRMPTWDEARELLNNCDGDVVEENGKVYVKLTSQINGNELIFPLWELDWKMSEEGKVENRSSCKYWTSNLDDEKSTYAICMQFNWTSRLDRTTWQQKLIFSDVMITFAQRFKGYAIRPVTKK